jgi:hypothetical protein
MKLNALFNVNKVIFIINGITLSKDFTSPSEAQSFIKKMSEEVAEMEDERGIAHIMSNVLADSFSNISEVISNSQKLLRAYALLKVHNLTNFFVIENNNIFLKVNQELFPTPISIIDYILRFENSLDAEKGLRALENFLILLLNNPNERVRTNVLEFIINHKFEMEERGMLVAYRNAKVKGSQSVKSNKSSDLPLLQFLNAEYVAIKKAKKGLAKFNVVQDPATKEFIRLPIEKEIGSYTLIGNFKDLYEDKVVNADDTDPEVEVETFTDAYSGSTTIQFGKPVRLPIEECDTDPQRDCSRGLHFGNISFMSANSFGNVGMMILVNPAKIVAVPYADRGKARCTEYLPIGKIQYDNNRKIIPLDAGVFSYEYLTNEYAKELEDSINAIKKDPESIYNSRKVSELMDVSVLTLIKNRINSVPKPKDSSKVHYEGE